MSNLYTSRVSVISGEAGGGNDDDSDDLWHLRWCRRRRMVVGRGVLRARRVRRHLGGVRLRCHGGVARRRRRLGPELRGRHRLEREPRSGNGGSTRRHAGRWRRAWARRGGDPRTAGVPVRRRAPPAATGGATCSVCLEEVRGGELVRSLPGCRDVFHVGCIDAWLQWHVTCPLCRSDLSPRR
ncbi:unnamed protein product [Urochloa humidicola]